MVPSFRRFFLRLVTLFRGGRAEAELSREIASHLQMLEDASIARGSQSDLFTRTVEAEAQPAADALRDALQNINPDELSPREALELLYRLKKLQ